MKDPHRSAKHVVIKKAGSKNPQDAIQPLSIETFTQTASNLLGARIEKQVLSQQVRLLSGCIVAALAVACVTETWREASARGVQAGGVTKTCDIRVGTTWDDALSCLKTNPYVVPGRDSVREAHEQLSPDRFRDIWKIWPASFYWQRVRLTFERPPDGPYRVIMVEEGDNDTVGR